MDTLWGACVMKHTLQTRALNNPFGEVCERYKKLEQNVAEDKKMRLKKFAWALRRGKKQAMASVIEYGQKKFNKAIKTVCSGETSFQFIWFAQIFLHSAPFLFHTHGFSRHHRDPDDVGHRRRRARPNTSFRFIFIIRKGTEIPLPHFNNVAICLPLLIAIHMRN